MIVRHLLQPEAIVSRRALLGGLACFGSVLALGGCADLGAAAPRFDASALSVDPTLLVATTRKPVNGGRAKPWFGPERASTMIVARAKLVPPGDSRSPRSDWPIGVLMRSNRCPEKSAIFSRRPAAEATS